MSVLFKTLPIILVFCQYNIAASQDHFTSKLDEFFNRIEENDKGMGSVSIFKDGSEVYQRSFGFLDVENAVKANAKTKYRIGSISKTFTATIIMQLVEEGKLKLDTKLSKFFPDLPSADEITINYMLRHRSGLFNFTSKPDYLSWSTEHKSRDELLELFIKNGMAFRPDTKAEYSNTNYVLLSFIIEDIEDASFSKILKQRILDPLKLEDTYFGKNISTDRNEAHSYDLSNDGWVTKSETDMSIPMGAGAIVSTPNDLNRFINALFAGELVNEESLQEMKKVEKGFQVGLFQFPFYERKAIGHQGGIDGFRATLGFFEDDRVALAYTSNGVVLAMNDILIGILSIYYDKDYELPEFAPSIEIKISELEKYVGTYSSEQLPMKIDIRVAEDRLMAQATGQSAFPLEAFGENKFRFERAGIVMIFNPLEQSFILEQAGGKYTYNKE